MRLDDLHYDLPPASIAQEPTARRDAARLLVLDRARGTTAHRHVHDLPRLLAPGDRLVVNDTRVLPARLFATRASGGRVEVFLLEPVGDGAWSAMTRAGGRLRAGEILTVAGGAAVRLLRRMPDGPWIVRGEDADLPALMARHGHMPLPPYIERAENDVRDALDRERYQTVMARHDGAVAAPTAGLHFTPALFEALADAGVTRSAVTLHVGLGTFEPVRTEEVEDHPMHEEAYVVPLDTAEAVARTKAAGGRIVAVGTTSVRALEASRGLAGAGRTDLLITPGYRFHVVDALLTNFHLPRSTLLALVAAFAGLEPVLRAYREAVAEGYRFYSYGDAMLIL